MWIALGMNHFTAPTMPGNSIFDSADCGHAVYQSSPAKGIDSCLRSTYFFTTIVISLSVYVGL